MESAYKRNGVEVIITPGFRNIGRSTGGLLLADSNSYWNGGRTTRGMVSLVRDIYFEPSFGHSAESMTSKIESKFRMRKPALLETHRFNFAGHSAQLERSVEELDKLLSWLVEKFPDIAFLTPAQLARCYIEEDGEVSIEPSMLGRMNGRLVRAMKIPKFKKILIVCLGCWLVALVTTFV